MEPKQASAEIAALADEVCAGSTRAQSSSRARPTPTTACSAPSSPGAIARARIYDDGPEGTDDDVLAEPRASTAARSPARASAPSTPTASTIRVEGGAQDGVGKAMLGGTVSILKGKGAKGKRVNGSVGKSFAYGAQRGRLFVQGSADSRFCIRLSGADVVLAGEPEQPLDDCRGCIVDRANAKGFAFEYMTSGRAVVLGDIGPWACAGMTGGRVYVRDQRRARTSTARRSSAGSARAPRSSSRSSTPRACSTSRTCSATTPTELRATDQDEEAERVLGLAADATAELPDDRPAEGPGGPEHLDRVRVDLRI